ncbi:hypothetical protein G4B88_007817 [Cannabis sativa]|uniref:Uncharacterized protein n=1 Tax=Cannabis sativa TaxID=3483 RepID=A0A7J6EQT4_CANSA|nr:hypothetical protein G4B88_007817 [Cannabis sativa]
MKKEKMVEKEGSRSSIDILPLGLINITPARLSNIGPLLAYCPKLPRILSYGENPMSAKSYNNAESLVWKRKKIHSNKADHKLQKTTDLYLFPTGTRITAVTSCRLCVHEYLSRSSPFPRLGALGPLSSLFSTFTGNFSSSSSFLGTLVPHSPSSPQPLPPFSSYSPSPSPSSPWRREQLTKSPSPRSLSRENHYVERQSGKLSPRTLADWRGCVLSTRTSVSLSSKETGNQT